MARVDLRGFQFRNLGCRRLGRKYGKQDFRRTPPLSYIRKQKSGRQSYYQPILDLLSYKPSILETNVASVLAEGKSDAYLLELFRKSFRPTSNLAIAPGTGAGSLDEIIRLLLCNGRPFIIVLDSDSEGDTQRKRYIDAFGPFLEGRIKRLDDFIPGFKGSIEQVLSEPDRIAIVNVHNPDSKASKKATGRAVEFVLARDGKFDFDAETEVRAVGLLEGLGSLVSVVAEEGSPSGK